MSRIRDGGGQESGREETWDSAGAVRRSAGNTRARRQAVRLMQRLSEGHKSNLTDIALANQVSPSKNTVRCRFSSRCGFKDHHVELAKGVRSYNACAAAKNRLFRSTTSKA